MPGGECRGGGGLSSPLPALLSSPSTQACHPLCHDCFLGRGGGLALEPVRGSPEGRGSRGRLHVRRGGSPPRPAVLPSQDEVRDRRWHPAAPRVPAQPPGRGRGERPLCGLHAHLLRVRVSLWLRPSGCRQRPCPQILCSVVYCHLCRPQPMSRVWRACWPQPFRLCSCGCHVPRMGIR